MSPLTITESGLVFGPFDEDQCFHVERSHLYASLGEGVKMVEFLLVKPDGKGVASLWCVEAKSSVPRQQTQPRFDEYFSEIREKMLNCLLLVVAALHGRHGAGTDELPAGVRALDPGTMGVRFVLVIPAAEPGWLPPLQDKMRDVLQSTMHAFRIDPASVAVLNEAGARKHGLVR